jgi:hypothetical protein
MPKKIALGVKRRFPSCFAAAPASSNTSAGLQKKAKMREPGAISQLMSLFNVNNPDKSLLGSGKNQYSEKVMHQGKKAIF